MKSIKVFLATVLLSATAFTQLNAKIENTSNTEIPSSNQISYSVYSSDYLEARNRLIQFIATNKYAISNQNETKRSFNYDFFVGENDLKKLDSMCYTLGYVGSKNLNSFNNQNRLAESQLELDRLIVKKSEFEKMLQRLDSVKSDEYYKHWEKIREIDIQMYNNKKWILQLEQIKNQYRVSIELNDELSIPSNSKINYVHMPGAEFIYFIPENPLTGLSYTAYQGVNLKYLFTKGKSYFSLGALKAIGANKQDSTAFNELFTFTFGQDWYSRNLGRGTRKFFNLYIGYQAGVSLAYTAKTSRTLPFVSPAVGVELFKNKYLLLETNVNYFLPLATENRNLRGLKVGASLLFSF